MEGGSRIVTVAMLAAGKTHPLPRHPCSLRDDAVIQPSKQQANSRDAAGSIDAMDIARRDGDDEDGDNDEDGEASDEMRAHAYRAGDGDATAEAAAAARCRMPKMKTEEKTHRTPPPAAAAASCIQKPAKSAQLKPSRWAS